jgi:chromosome partitioning protein
MGAPKTRIIAVANEKGGVGKTVTVLNIGAVLSQKGLSVLIVDMDPQSNATRGLGVGADETMTTIYDVMMNKASASVNDAILQTRWKNLDLIPAHIDLAGAEVELINEIGRENRLKEVLGSLKEKYDFILLDTPPSLSLLTVNVFTYANEVLVPCQTHPYAYDALDELFDTIFALKREINPDLQVTGIVATLFDCRTRVSQRILEKLKNNDRYKTLLLDTVIRINTTIAESADVGKPVVFFRSGSYGAIDYKNLTDELLTRY